MTPERTGPRPLALHLATSAAVSMSSPAAFAAARSGSTSWSASANLTRIAHAAADADALARAVAAEATRRLAEFVAGVRAYRAHPYRRPESVTTTIWRRGSSRLLDYGGPGRAVLLAPSLVNRAHILDLRPNASFCAWLRTNGLRPLLLDWGPPGAAERDFGLDAYIARRLGPALRRAVETAGGPVPVVGYCMGGLLALAAAGLHPDRVAGLALLATPWDFHADRAGQAGILATAAGLPAAPGAPPLPVDLIQALFASLQPGLIQAKFRRFAAMDPESAEAEAFVALEDWLNDGVALAAPAARDCLVGWYRDNEPADGRWRVGGEPVDPARVARPAFVALPTRDRIVPPASASALAARLPAAITVEPRAGHIGMMVGGRARAALWEPLGDWLRRV